MALEEADELHPLKARFRTLPTDNPIMTSEYSEKYKSIMQAYERIRQKIKTSSAEVKPFASVKHLEQLNSFLVSSTLSITAE